MGDPFVLLRAVSPLIQQAKRQKARICRIHQGIVKCTITDPLTKFIQYDLTACIAVQNRFPDLLSVFIQSDPAMHLPRESYRIYLLSCNSGVRRQRLNAPAAAIIP